MGQILLTTKEGAEYDVEKAWGIVSQRYKPKEKKVGVVEWVGLRWVGGRGRRGLKELCCTLRVGGWEALIVSLSLYMCGQAVHQPTHPPTHTPCRSTQASPLRPRRRRRRRRRVEEEEEAPKKKKGGGKKRAKKEEGEEKKKAPVKKKKKKEEEEEDGGESDGSLDEDGNKKKKPKKKKAKLELKCEENEEMADMFKELVIVKRDLHPPTHPLSYSFIHLDSSSSFKPFSLPLPPTHPLHNLVCTTRKETGSGASLYTESQPPTHPSTYPPTLHSPACTTRKETGSGALPTSRSTRR